MAGRQYRQVAYGLSQPLINENPQFIYGKRDPTTVDFAIPSTIWINSLTNTIFILATVANNVANWVQVEAGGGAGVFASLIVNPGPIALTGTTTINTVGAAVTTIGTGGTGAVNIGNATGNTAVTGSLGTTTTLTAGTGITATTGNITAAAGNINATLGSMSAGTTVTAGTGMTATTGNITAAAGNIVATLGNITASAGNIAATLGSVSAGTTVTAGTGVTATTGNITAAAGNIVATLGSMSAGTTVTAGTGVTATTGNIALGNAAGHFLFQNGIGIYSGTGDPNGALAAAEGSLYLRTDGSGAADRAWINTNGGTVWTAVVTVA